MVDQEFEERFAETFEGISEIYGKAPSPFVFELFLKALERFGIDAIEKAFVIHTQDTESGKFFPKPSDIIRIIEGSSKDTAYNAWTKVIKAIGSVGSYQSVVFDDPIIHRVIQDMSSWVTICATSEKELPFIKNDFIKRYEGFKRQGEIPEFTPKLIGQHDCDNIANGFADQLQAPTLIGNPEKAKEVLRLGSERPSLMITQGDDLKKIEVKQLPCLN